LPYKLWWRGLPVAFDTSYNFANIRFLAFARAHGYHAVEVFPSERAHPKIRNLFKPVMRIRFGDQMDSAVSLVNVGF